MSTFKLTGKRDSYWLSERHYKGVGTADYTRVTPLSNEEADCLVQCRYFNPTQENGTSSLDPRTLLSVGPHKNSYDRESLIVTLPRNDELNRGHYDFIDPGLHPATDPKSHWRVSTGWYDQFRKGAPVVAVWEFRSNRKRIIL
jgi:hypothetical protein